MKKIKVIHSLIILSFLVGCAANKPPTPTSIYPSNKSISATPRQMPTLADFEQTFSKALTSNTLKNIEQFSDITQVDTTGSPYKLCSLDNFPNECPGSDLNLQTERWRMPPGEAKSQVEARRQSAMRILNKLAEDGDKEVQFGLAKLYQFGMGPDTNIDHAIKWYLKAAEAGQANSAEMLGTLYWLGLGLPQDFSLSMDWYSKAAKLDSKKLTLKDDSRVEKMSYGWIRTVASIIRDFPLEAKAHMNIYDDAETLIMYSSDGKVQVRKSSGKIRADNHAVQIVREAIAKAPPPEEVKHKPFQVVVPIQFNFR
jgi:TonB family protein